MEFKDLWTEKPSKIILFQENCLIKLLKKHKNEKI
jgi:hypothetical protein